MKIKTADWIIRIMQRNAKTQPGAFCKTLWTIFRNGQALVCNRV